MFSKSTCWKRFQYFRENKSICVYLCMGRDIWSFLHRRYRWDIIGFSKSHFSFLPLSKRKQKEQRWWKTLIDLFISPVLSLYLFSFSELIGIFNGFCPVHLSLERFWIWFHLLLNLRYTLTGGQNTSSCVKLIPRKEPNTHMHRNTEMDLKADKYNTEIKD